MSDYFIINTLSINHNTIQNDHIIKMSSNKRTIITTSKGEQTHIFRKCWTMMTFSSLQMYNEQI